MGHLVWSGGGGLGTLTGCPPKCMHPEASHWLTDRCIWHMSWGHAKPQKVCSEKTLPFGGTFHLQCVQIILTWNRVTWVLCHLCKWASILWTAGTACAALQGRAIWTLESSTPRVSDHSLQIPEFSTSTCHECIKFANFFSMSNRSAKQWTKLKWMDHHGKKKPDGVCEMFKVALQELQNRGFFVNC